MSLPWKGNVRELDNVIEHTMILAEGERITCKDLPAAVIASGAGQRVVYVQLEGFAAISSRSNISPVRWNKPVRIARKRPNFWTSAFPLFIAKSKSSGSSSFLDSAIHHRNPLIPGKIFSEELRLQLKSAVPGRFGPLVSFLPFPWLV